MSPLPTGTRFPIQVISQIKPAGNGSFPVVADVDIEGGYQVREDITDRNSIPAANRKIGMLVYVVGDDKFYTLLGGIDDTDWIERDFGGGGGGTLAGDVTGPAGTNVITSINGIALNASSPTNGGSLHYVQQIDSTLFPKPQSIATDGTHVWVGNYQTKIITKTNLNTRVSTNIDLTAVMPGGASSFPRSIKRHSSYPNYIFFAGMDSTRVYIMDNTDAIIGMGSVGTDRTRCVTVDNSGNLWVGSHSGSGRCYKFNIANMISSYPTVVSPSLAIVASVITDYEDIQADGNFIWGTSNNGDLCKLSTISNTDLGNYASGFWYDDLIVDSGFVWVIDQQNTQISKFDPSTWTSGPVANAVLTNISYLTSFCLKGGYFWVPDNSSSSGVDRDNLVKVQQSPFSQVAYYGPPGTETYWHGIVADPVLPRIYVAVFNDSVTNNFGFRVFDTNTNTWVDSFTKLGAPQIKYIPATCTTAARPANPFVGQMVFVTDLDTPNPIALWWNGNFWVDDQGFTR